MKGILITVREDYVVPRLFHDTEGSPELREAALNIGARAVEDVIRIELQKQPDRAGELLEARQRLEQAEVNLAEALKSQKMSRERQQQLLAQLTKQQHEHDEQLAQVRREIATRMEEERGKVWAEVEARAKRDAEQAVREAILTERERRASEHEEVIARLHEKHETALTQLEARILTSVEAERKAHELLRAEHEGLTTKLMSRLEPLNSRVGSSASLGRSFETNVATHLRNVFGARPGFELMDVHATGHSGDLVMVYDGLRILIELKSYDPKTKVPTKEVEKLARDLAEVQPPCDAGIMISACCEITGYYSCGPLEVCSDIARVPILFINNFLSLGDPMITLHMTRVFLGMIQGSKVEEEVEIGEEAERMAECARRCTSYLSELSKQSAELLRQVTVMRTTATKLRETVLSFVETEVSRYSGILGLMTRRNESEEPVILDRTVFNDPNSMTSNLRKLALRLTEAYSIGNHREQCVTKDLLEFAKSELGLKSEKQARDALKAVFLESVVKHGHVVGIAKKTE